MWKSTIAAPWFVHYQECDTLLVRAAFDITGLLAIGNPLFIFHLFLFSFVLHTWFQFPNYMLMDNKQIWHINLYGANNDDPSFFENIYKNLSLDSIIMVGDFNTVLNTSMDRKRNHTTNYHRQALKEIMNVMEILELVYIWRLKYPDLVRYTWGRLNTRS